MLSVQDNELITRTGPGTPMGELMRRYWQPVCALDELLRSPFRTKEQLVMGEEIVVYMDRSGTLGVVDKYCTHRRASLAYGVVEEHGIRCQYHGWKFDETGECIEQPFEDTTHPEDNFRSKCGIKSYKVEELGGLVFVYMGPEPAPLLPRWGPLVWTNAVRDIAIVTLPCNWLQCQENSLDPVHTEWLHNYAGTYFKELVADKEPSFVHRGSHGKIGFELFEYGIIKRRMSIGGTEEDDEWKVGHPILFPNILCVGSPLNTTLEFRVPTDDEHCLHFSYHSFRPALGSVAPKQDVIPSRIVPLYDDKGFLIADIQRNQDFLAWITQGPIAKRDLEHLGESDRGIIMFRRLLLEQIELMRDGGEPTIGVIRDPVENECIVPPLEPSRFSEEGRASGQREGQEGERRRRPYIPQEAGAREFSDGYANETSLTRAAEEIEEVMATWRNMTPEEIIQVGATR